MVNGMSEVPAKDRPMIFCQRLDCQYNNQLREGQQVCGCAYMDMTGHSRIAASGGELHWSKCKCYRQTDDPDILKQLAKREKKKAGAEERKSEKLRELDEQLTEHYANGAGDREMERITGIRDDIIRWWRRMRGLEPNIKRGPNMAKWEERDAILRPLYDKGMTDYEMAQATGMHHGMVNKWRNMYGLHYERATPKNQKRNREMDADICKMYTEGKSRAECAAKYGICTDTVSRVLYQNGLIGR